MIVNFSCPDTHALFVAGHAPRLTCIEHAALRKLDLLNCAVCRADVNLCSPLRPRHDLKKYALPIEGGWTLRFAWQGNCAHGVHITCDNEAPSTEANAAAIASEDQKRIVSHPGEILREEFMLPLDLSSNRIAMAISVPVSRMLDIVNERRGITSDTASRLARFFGNSPRFWSLLQMEYELSVIRQEKKPLLDGIDSIA